MRGRDGRMIVTIDGPAGSGKSTTARAVAERLGFRHLDSGAFYRAITLVALRAETPVERWAALAAADLDRFNIHAQPAGDATFRLFTGDEDITGDLRSADVNANVSRMAELPAVRGWLFGRLRNAAEGGDLVADGRDMGTVVFPDAHLKVFLTADLAERARRRLEQEGRANPSPEEIAAEVRRIAERDRVDTERQHAPLQPATDAIVVDTTRLGFDEQVDRIIELARARQAKR
ncbi:MAG: (d)CMP kinase [Longimicrobiales bacterium]